MREGDRKSPHAEAEARLSSVDQRYTPMRRSLVDTLAGAGRPLTMPELLERHPDLPQSSAYRNVTTLIEASVVRRVSGADDHGRFELAEDLSHHHHHLVCVHCGDVTDALASTRLERALEEAARVVADEEGFVMSEHRFDLIGTCARCAGNGIDPQSGEAVASL